MIQRHCICLLTLISLSFSPALQAWATIECYQCHGTSNPVDYRPLDTLAAPFRNPSSGGFQGNHRTHLNAPSSHTACTPCHPGSDSYLSSHRNGKIRVSAHINNSQLSTPYNNTTSAFSQTATPTLGKCDNVNCHFEAITPTWGSDPAATTCSTCHGSPPGDGSHPKHATYYGSDSTSCLKCHQNNPGFAHATSVGKRSLNVQFTTTPNSGGSYSGTLTYPSYLNQSRNGTCTGLYCHSNGTSVATGSIPANTSPAWGSGVMPCNGCHGNPPSYSNGSPKKNNHGIHAAYGCNKCHYRTTTNGTAITNNVNHVNKIYDVYSGAGARFTYNYNASGGTCNSISCHGTTSAQWGSTSCLGCHSVAQGNRAAVASQFGANSHHIQGTVTDAKCYQCHWEANSDGSINSSYHHSSSPDAPVELVVYGTGTRPVTYTTSSFLGGISNSGGGAWTKGASVVINNSGNSSILKNYQVKITVTYDSDMKSDFSDLRFFDGTTELSYWVESYSASVSAAVWVKVPLIPASSSKTITMYYGNPLATSSGNAGATLIPNSITALVGNCTNETNCAYMDNHAEANSIRGYPADIGTLKVPSIYWGSVWNGSSPGSNVRDQFFSRFRFLFIPDVSGAWQFAVDSDDASELILNPNDRLSPSGEQVIASTYGGQGWSNSQVHAGSLTVTANQGYWLDYLQEDWGGGEAAVLWAKRPGDSWKNLSAQNYANMIFSRNYTAPEPTFSIGTEQSVNISNGVATAVQYTASNSRTEIQKINYHCLGCHSDQNNASQPFGDGKTPKQYAWDGTSVAARYSQAGTTQWGKYSVSPKDAETKAFSAHGNAVRNQGGWDTNETWPDTRSSITIVACYDCHNSHGSTASGTTTSYASATANAGILKDTTAGKGGYSQTYQPASGGSGANKNAYNTGAGLCFDCHLTPNAGTKPWGYSDTYGATQKIIGYWDTDYFGPGTFGSQTRYPFKAAKGHMGGHFGASSTLSSTPTTAIGGICTPCHDPHGVSPTLGSKQQYSVPLLKGTWITSPYREDTAPATARAPGEYPDQTGLGAASYHIDQNTFGSSLGGTIPASTFRNVSTASGLCLGCHSKNSLTTPACSKPGYYTQAACTTAGGTWNANPWKSKDRIHEAVNGWKTSDATVKHNYSCSKCHAVHNSRLPRLMVTDCLDSPHKGRSAFNGTARLTGDTSASGDNGGGSGSGRFPGVYNGSGSGGQYYPNLGPAPGSFSVACHESPAANNGANSNLDQSWNVKTPWIVATAPPAPTAIHQSSTISSGGNISRTLQWNAVACSSGAAPQYYVEVSSVSSFATISYNSGWISAVNWTQSLPIGTWYWRVTARDSVVTSAQSAPSASDSFSIVYTVPSAPTLIAPGNTNSSGGNVSKTLTWNAVTPNDGDAIQYFVEVSSVSNFATIAASSPWQSATSWAASLPIGTWYWRVTARDSVHTTAVSSPSSTNSFAITYAPPEAPTLIPQPNYSSGTNVNVNFQWNTALPVDGDALEYYVEVSNASNFSPVSYNSSWQAATSWTQSLPTGTWYWRVKSRDSVHTTAVSTPSSANSFLIASGPLAPLPPDLIIQSGVNTDCASSTTHNLQWNVATIPDGDAADYYVQVDTAATFNSANLKQSGWIQTLSWTTPSLANSFSPGTIWYWRVKSRDRGHQTYESAYNPTAGSFTDSNNITGCTCGNYDCSCDDSCGGSCPLVFAWDGLKFIYETDLQGPVIGVPQELAEIDVRLFQPVYTVLKGLVPDGNNQYKIKIRESLPEMTFMDELKLLAVDYPEGYQIVTSGVETTYDYGYMKPFRIYTIKNPVPPIAATDKNGKDILATVLSVDNNPAPTYWSTEDYYTFDFGAIKHPENAKLLIDGWSLYGYETQQSDKKIQPFIEVVDKSGKWVKVKSFGTPAGDLKTMVVDISNIFLSADQRIRVYLGIRKISHWVIDRVRLDDSAPVAVNVKEMAVASANLRFGGNAIQSMSNLKHRIMANDVSLPLNPKKLSYGNFTRYGDVTELLSARDDIYAIMRQGDAIDLAFPSAGKPQQGMVREFIIKAELYYKSMITYKQVEPIPFHGMSAYPYPANEIYPQDKKHREYRERYNTRGYTEPGVVNIQDFLPLAREAHATDVLLSEKAAAGPIPRIAAREKRLEAVGMTQDNPPRSQPSLWQWLGGALARIWLLVASVLHWLKSLMSF